MVLVVYEVLVEMKSVVVRFRGKEYGCIGCFRIMVGIEEEVIRFFEVLRRILVEVRKIGGKVDGVEEESKEKVVNGVVV